ncbi:rhodanese-like domain-containing protein [Glaciecola sp. XM2]|jgi:rhodanese-related sulfurtransferase|uniref:rhodanese-like domain-containing protein n=1 Tax=Glaciecola sp. XM2 TaxID=1914931 RepID=UPI001BDF38CB|nr:rhodanese-like domain-containing protein [Glaciecola sp. XM2]MBT1452506.1 rhodanese-like domain-containing protein [Glaciecola sp. XM2]
MKVYTSKILALIATLTISLGSSAFANTGVITELSHDAFDALTAQQETMIIDVRTPEEYADGHVPGAINVPVATVIDNLSVFGEKNTPIVVYCRSGYRAGKALEVLANAGFGNLHHLEGDITAWKEANKPMEMPETDE